MTARSLLPRPARRRARASSLLPCSCALAVAGCLTYPDSSERIDDDIVATGYAETVAFEEFSTFAIDPVVHLATVQEDDSVESGVVDASMSTQLVDRVVSNLEARGFRRVEVGDRPDLGVTLTAISGYVDGAVTGGYYGGYYGSYWGYPGYSYYYPYAVEYSYRPGTLVIDIADLASMRAAPSGGGTEDTEQPAEGAAPTPDAGPGELPGAEERAGGLPVVWTMVAYKAFLDGQGSSERVNAATRAIDQAFEQSPYLRSE